MVKNVIEEIIVPVNPKVLPREQISVYIPTASNEYKGLASYDKRYFNVINGEVSLLPDLIYSQKESDAKYAQGIKFDIDIDTDVAYAYLTDEKGNVLSADVAKFPMNVVLNSKLDRINLTPGQSDRYWVYAIEDSNSAGMIQCESDIKADTIVYRGSDGHFKVNDPVEDEHPTNKRYVDLTCEEFVTRVSMVYDSRNYTMTLVYNSVLPDGSVSRRLLGPVIDLPLESVVLNVTYDNEAKSIILELVNGNTVTIPVAELVSGLAKEDKVVPLEAIIAGNAAMEYVYGRAYDGKPVRIGISQNNPLAYRIPQYTKNRTLRTLDPTEDLDCANKKYVDDAVANAGGSSSQKLYLHTISLAATDGGYIDPDFKVINTDPANYTKRNSTENPLTKDDFAFLFGNVVFVGGQVEDDDGIYPVAYAYASADTVQVDYYKYDDIWSFSVSYEEWDNIYDTVKEVM